MLYYSYNENILQNTDPECTSVLKMFTEVSKV